MFSMLLLAVAPGFVCGQSLEANLRKEPSHKIADEAKKSGDAQNGARVFHSRMLACATCHSLGDSSEGIGPDLTKLAPEATDEHLVESVLLPSKVINPRYSMVAVEMLDGRSLQGLPVEENAQQLVLRDSAKPDKLMTLLKSEIAEQTVAKQSLMPAGQVNQLTDRQQFLDLIKYLIEVRNGGVKRASELQPPSEGIEFPDKPLAWLPVVQRGEVMVEPQQRYPFAVTLGFPGGTVLFDADRLGTVAWWSEGMLKSKPQNYFGVSWEKVGKIITNDPTKAAFPVFQFAGSSDWQAFEPAKTSDPNTGTRFNGYQIGKSSVRLNYHLLVSGQRIAVAETIRAELRPGWQGLTREYRFTGLLDGARVALNFPLGNELPAYDATGAAATNPQAAANSPLRSFKDSDKQFLLRIDPMLKAQWEADTQAKSNATRLVSAPATKDQPTLLRVDQWVYRGTAATPTAAELSTLTQNPPVLDTNFDAPQTSPKPLERQPPIAVVKPAAPTRPKVDPKENLDEFPPVAARFLRFHVLKTTDHTSPGIDELEIYGPNSPQNLALAGKATASSVIAGYPIHQIPHLNDGKLGNKFSWISAEKESGWAQIEFPETVKVNKIVWARDRTGGSRDRLATSYRIEVSNDGQNWQKVGDEAGRGVKELTAPIRKDAAPGYEMEAIPLPFPACRPSDIAFGSDGTIYLLAMTEGQVWRAKTPQAGHPEQIQWQRYAAGLTHPIGLAVVDDRLYVSQRPEVTELIDNDQDGIVDHYRTVATGWGLSPSFHEYCFGLAVDNQKNLWVALNTGNFWTHPGLVALGRWRGAVLRIAHGTEKLEVVATGCRVPNGITRGPDGNIFYTDNQGDWIASCKLAPVVPGRFYGHPETKADQLPAGKYPDGLSAVWLPHDRSRSTSGPVHDATEGRFGPFANQLFVGDVGYGANTGVMRLALEKIAGEFQGACIPFLDGQPAGCERMKFGPDDKLYMASLATGLTRLSYNGKTPAAIQSLKIRPRGAGFTIHFTQPLAKESQLTAKNIHVSRYHYRYSGAYGSPKVDEKTMDLQKFELSADRKSLTLDLPVETNPFGMVYYFKMTDLEYANGVKQKQHEAWYTVQRIPE